MAHAYFKPIREYHAQKQKKNAQSEAADANAPKEHFVPKDLQSVVAAAAANSNTPKGIGADEAKEADVEKEQNVVAEENNAENVQSNENAAAGKNENAKESTVSDVVMKEQQNQ